MFSGDSDVSSKRVVGAFLVVIIYGVSTLIATIKGDISEPVVKLISAGLYTGAALLGLGIADRLVTLTKKK